MNPRSWELIVSLLTRPGYQDAPVVHRAAKRLLNSDESQALMRSLAEKSLPQAREVLAHIEKLLGYWELEPLQRVVDDIEEQVEGQKLALASDEELMARATLHVLLPPEDPRTALQTRILAWALHERNPELAAALLLHIGEGDYDFWDRTEALRQNLVVRLREESPDKALALLSQPSEALDWLYHLIDSPPGQEALFARLVDYLRGYGYWPGVRWEMLLELAQQTLKCRPSLSGMLLIAIADWLRTGSDLERETRATEFFLLCQQVPFGLRRELGEHLRSEVMNAIPRPQRRLFLRRLAHWLRPVLQGEDDSLQRDLQSDRATALLMHLPIRRLAKAHFWQVDLAPRQRRRFMRRCSQLWQPYLQRQKVLQELVATLDAIATQKSDI